MYYSIVIYKLRKCVNMHVHWTDTARTLHGHCTDVRVRSTDMRVHDTDVHAHCTDTRVHCTDMHVHARRQISTILYVSCLIHRWSLGDCPFAEVFSAFGHPCLIFVWEAIGLEIFVLNLNPISEPDILLWNDGMSLPVYHIYFLKPQS